MSTILVNHVELRMGIVTKEQRNMLMDLFYSEYRILKNISGM